MSYNPAERSVSITSAIVIDKANNRIKRIVVTAFVFNEVELRSLLNKKYPGRNIFIGSSEYHKPLFYHSLLKNKTEKARILLIEDEPLMS